MRLHFGLGAAAKIDWVQVRWPRRLFERFENFSVNSVHPLEAGTGVTPHLAP
jgi:enediyne biosynthesis protein E4